MDQRIFSSAPFHGKNGQGWQVNMPVTGQENGQGPAIDLNEQLIKNRPATFFMRVNSNAMIGAGIHAGDVVIVDRSLEARNGRVIIAVLDGEMLIRRLDIGQNKKRLVPATQTLAPIEITPDASFEIWGVVTYVIHSL